MKRISILILIIFSISSTVAFSQSRHEKVISAKTNFVSKEMGLTDEERESFTPLYKEYCKKKAAAKKVYRSNFKSNKESSTDVKSADAILDSEQAIIDLERKYIHEFEAIIPESKVAKLFIAEKKFRKMLMKRVKSHK